RRGRHVLRLHFYPFSRALASARFHVGAGGFLLLHNFTASSPVVKDFLLPVDADVLVLTFVPEAGSAAFVNAIELFSAPDELVGDIATLVAAGGVNRTDGLSSQVFETLYRVNVAGRKVTPFNDTLWRTWVNDEGFLVNKESSSSKAWSFGGRIAYPKDSRLMTREVAPDNGHLAVKDFDISSTTGYLAYPYYIDYVVDVEDEGMLKLAIGGSKMSRPGEASGFLNGLEIMRMNKTGGGMDGDFPAVLDMGYLVSKGFGEFARSLLCGLVFAGLFLVLVMLVLRLRTELKNNGTLWFSQSMDSGEGKLAKAYQLVPTKTDY
uniref:Uncharacterized protein n=1 Tax=Aegilops tauschii subsp. strangulata TaxID=200361 RepID=A0A453J5P4_AEGTS